MQSTHPPRMTKTKPSRAKKSLSCDGLPLLCPIAYHSRQLFTIQLQANRSFLQGLRRVSLANRLLWRFPHAALMPYLCRGLPSIPQLTGQWLHSCRALAGASLSHRL